MTAPTTFACPGCGAATAGGTSRCERCGIRLVGELAMQLWRLDQQLAALRVSREMLVARLRRDDSGDVLPAYAVRSAPGSETRRTLLVLGAVCLIAAVTAGTALIWPALGVGGQTAVMVALTAALLAGAVRLQHRLPATAEAVAAVGVAATAVDVIAGRRLVAPGLSGTAARGYWILAAAVALAVLTWAASRAPRLHAMTVGAVAAAFGVVVAIVEPQTLGSLALTGLAGACLGISLVRFAGRLPLSRAAAAAAAALGGTVLAFVSVAAAFSDARQQGLALVCGLLVTGIVGGCTDLGGRPSDHSERRTVAAVGGVVAGALLITSQVVPLGTWALLTAGVAGAMVFVLAVPPRSRAQVTVATYVGAGAVVTEISAQVSLQLNAADPLGLSAAAGMAVATVLLVVVALLAYSERLELACVAAAAATSALVIAVAEGASVKAELIRGADAASVVAIVVFTVASAPAAIASRRPALVAAAIAVPAGPAAAIAVDVSLALHHVSITELYVVAPGAVAATSGGIAMRRLPSISSWALTPALAVSLLPTLLLAWRGDTGRQVAMLMIGAALVAMGAQCRLAAPMAAGSIAIVTVVLRVLGPQVAELPRWLTLGVLGAALLVLGSTWERRLQEMRRVAERVRPTVAALR